MSLYYIIASNCPLKEQKNPYIHLLSVNEALARGMDIDVHVFEEGFDFDKPEVILSIEDEVYFAYPNIYLVKKEDFREDIASEKDCLAILEWDYTEEYVEVVLDYLASQMASDKEIELWKVWIGTAREEYCLKSESVSIKKLKKEKLRAFFEDKHEYMCLKIQSYS